MKLKDVIIGDYISLNKLTGKKVKDIRGYISCEFGDPTFVTSKVIFEDDTMIFFGSEHDTAFLDDDNRIFDDEVLQSLYDEEKQEEE